MAQSLEVTRGLLAAARIYFYGKQATVNGTDVQALEVFNHTREGLSFGPTIAEMLQSISSSTSSAFGRATSENKSGQEVEARPRLNIGVLHTEASPTTFTNTDWIKRPEIRGEFEEKMRVLHKWQTSTSSASGLYDPNVSAAVSIAVAIAIGYVTAGTGSLFTSFAKMGMTKGLGILGTQMAAAGARAALVGITSQAVMGLARGQTPDEVAHELVSTDSMKALAVDVIVASLVGGGGAEARSLNLLQHLEVQALRSFLRGSLQVIIQGDDPRTVMQGALKSTVTGAFGAYLAGEIGKAYRGGYGTIDPLTHKILHGLLGGGLGAIISDNPTQGALSGAIGAMVAETVADMMTEEPNSAMARMVREEKAKGKNLTVAQYLKAYNAHVHRNMDVARIIAAFSAVLINTDVHAAHYAVQNAVENNAVMAIPLAAVAIEEMLLCLGLSATGTLLVEDLIKKYDDYQRNKSEGFAYQDIEESKPTILVTPQADALPLILTTPQAEPQPQLPGFMPAGDDFRPTLEGFDKADPVDIRDLIHMKGELPKDIPAGTWLPPQEALDKIPNTAGVAKPINDGEGWRWVGKYGENVVRINKGRPDADYPTQQIDYVKIQSGGKTIGLNGQIIEQSKTIREPSKTPEAHIPLTEWLKWNSWNSQ